MSKREKENRKFIGSVCMLATVMANDVYLENIPISDLILCENIRLETFLFSGYITLTFYLVFNIRSTMLYVWEKFLRFDHLVKNLFDFFLQLGRFSFIFHKTVNRTWGIRFIVKKRDEIPDK